MSPVIELYSSIECPYAYLAVHRLRQVWPAYAGRVQILWRALSLEYINEEPHNKPNYDAERGFFPLLTADLPWQPWPRPEWAWPVTLWPAFEALACAQAQGHDAAFAFSWALRHAFFHHGRNLSLRHELLAIAQATADEGHELDVARLTADWDSGRYKQTVLNDSRRGWHELKLEGSATFVLPDGRRLTNPAVGEIDYDEENHVLRNYTPYDGEPLDAYQAMLSGVVNGGD
jgi:predicted DsbA family dithiol-disulfide isomerase